MYPLREPHEISKPCNASCRDHSLGTLGIALNKQTKNYTLSEAEKIYLSKEL